MSFVNRITHAFLFLIVFTPPHLIWGQTSNTLTTVAPEESILLFEIRQPSVAADAFASTDLAKTLSSSPQFSPLVRGALSWMQFGLMAGFDETWDEIKLRLDNACVALCLTEVDPDLEPGKIPPLILAFKGTESSANWLFSKARERLYSSPSLLNSADNPSSGESFSFQAPKPGNGTWLCQKEEDLLLFGPEESLLHFLHASSSKLSNIIPQAHSEWWLEAPVGLLLNLKRLKQLWPAEEGSPFAGLYATESTLLLASTEFQEGQFVERFTLLGEDRFQTLHAPWWDRGIQRGQGLPLLSPAYPVVFSLSTGPLDEELPALAEKLMNAGKEKEGQALKTGIDALDAQFHDAGTESPFAHIAGEILLGLRPRTNADLEEQKQQEGPLFVLALEMTNEVALRASIEKSLRHWARKFPDMKPENIQLENMLVTKVGDGGSGGIYYAIVGHHLVIANTPEQISQLDRIDARTPARPATASTVLDSFCTEAPMSLWVNTSEAMQWILGQAEKEAEGWWKPFFLSAFSSFSQDLADTEYRVMYADKGLNLAGASPLPGPCTISSLISLSQFLRDSTTRTCEQSKERMKKIAKAISDYHKKHGTAPERLEDLVPTHLKSLPMDPWSQDHSFQYDPGLATELAGGQRLYVQTWMLWSVGPDKDVDIHLKERSPSEWQDALNGPLIEEALKEKIWQYKKKHCLDERLPHDEGDLIWLGSP